MESTHKHKPHYLPLDSIRGIAALSVAIHHVILMKVFLAAFSHKAWFDCAFFHNAWLFVDLFFVLSGIVISISYTDADFGKFSFRDFMVRRLARIYPLHIVMLFAILIFRFARVGLVAAGLLAVTSPQFEVNNAYTFVLNIFLLHSLGFVDYLSWNGPSWSISVEFYTYILFALVLLFAQRLNSRPFLYAVAALLVVGNWFVIVFVLQKKDLGLQYDFGILRCVMSFFLGVLVVRAVAPLSKIKAPVYQFGLQAGSLVASVGLVVIVSDYPAASFAAPFVFASLLATLMAFPGAPLLPRLLESKPFVWLGARSYSIYMVHAFVILLAEYAVRIVGPRPIVAIDSISPGLAATLTYGVIIAAVILLSDLTYRLVEVPGGKFVRRLLQRETSFSAAQPVRTSRRLS
jgi:peptidoglycan/LPS O-acetylase OafA/YrhL